MARRTCRAFKYVRVKGRGRQRRCARYTTKRRGYARKKSSKRRYSAKRRRPFNKGKRCVEFGTNRRGQRTCLSYGATSRWRRKAGGQRRYAGDSYGRAEAASWERPSVVERLKAAFTRREAELSGFRRYRR